MADLQSKYNMSLNESKAPVEIDTSEIEAKFKE
jgi:hypothetical protein